MLQRVRTVALNTYREAVRGWIFLGLALVAAGVTLSSFVISSMTLKSAPRVVADLGAASISLLAIITSIIIAASSLYREVEQKTIFPILARPIHRAEYIVGKYLGTLLTVAVFIAADTGFVLFLSAGLGGAASVALLLSGLGLLSVLFITAIRSADARTWGLIPFALAALGLGILFSGTAPDERRMLLMSSLLCFFEVAIVTAIATLLAAFSTPFVSAALAIGIWIIGRCADRLAAFPVKLFGKTIASAAVALSKAVPNLQVYVPPRPILTGEALDANTPHYLLLSGTNALAWSVGIIALACLVFKKRDFL